MTEEPYRCHETIDLEDMIKMIDDKNATRSRALVVWNSGREEEFTAELNKGGDFKKSFTDKVANYRKFPTVKSVHVEKY